MNLSHLYWGTSIVFAVLYLLLGDTQSANTFIATSFVIGALIKRS